MAMIVCRECGSEISSLAKTCPKCGAPVNAVPDSVEGSAGSGKKSSYTAGGVVNIIGGMGFYLLIILLAALAAAAGGSSSTAGNALSPIGGVVGDMFWALSWIILIVISVMSFVLILYKRLDTNTAFVLCAVQLALSILSFLCMLCFWGWALLLGAWLVMWPMLLQLIGSSLCMSAAAKARKQGSL